MTYLTSDSTRIPKFGGKIWYVNAGTGSDAYSGSDPSSPFATIGAGITAASAGDAINVKAGTYDENGLTLGLTAMELWCEIGVAIVDTATGTQTLLITGNSCRIRGPLNIAQAGQIGLKVTGDYCIIEDVLVTASSVGFDLDGDGSYVGKSESTGHTTTGFDVSGANSNYQSVNAIGSGGATRGFYLSASTADGNVFNQAFSTGNATAGFEVSSTGTENVFTFSVSGGGDGKKVDNGTRTQWSNSVFKSLRERHEEVYPYSDGEGAAGLPLAVSTNAEDESNGAATSQNYWGEPKVIMPTTTLTDDFDLCGYHIYGTTTNKVIGFTFYRINYNVSSAKNGGNAWDEAATVLTVADGSHFQTDDLVWIYSDYKTDGEIVRVTGVATNVVTIEREASQFGADNTGLRWNHTTNNAGTEVMYLVYRSANLGMHGTVGQWSCASAKDYGRYNFHECRELRANDGILIRSLNKTDGTNGTSFDVAIIYED